MNSTRIKTAEEGFNKVHEQGQKFAFLWDVAIIEYKILTDQDCSLTTVKVRILDQIIILTLALFSTRCFFWHFGAMTCITAILVTNDHQKHVTQFYTGMNT